MDSATFITVVREMGVQPNDVSDDLVVAGAAKHQYNVQNFVNEYHQTGTISITGADVAKVDPGTVDITSGRYPVVMTELTSVCSTLACC